MTFGFGYDWDWIHSINWDKSEYYEFMKRVESQLLFLCEGHSDAGIDSMTPILQYEL